MRYNKGQEYMVFEVFIVATQKLYYEDVNKRVFFARVLSCEQAKEHWNIVLDRTAFYPEGGGQPGDNGVLNCVNVLDTHEKNGEILHVTDAPLPVGARVVGGIDWPLRRSRMQEHTGEHIFTGVLHRFFGVNNVGFHMGSACVTLDLDKPLTEEQIELGETLANEAVFQDLPVEITYPTPEELKTLHYRSKKELSGQVRIVTIPGYDVCACCGTHVTHTGEIGLIKVIGWMHYKGGVRISILCGSRAMQHFDMCQNTVTAISGQLSAKPEAVMEAVQRLQQERDALRQQLATAQNDLFAAKAQTMQPGDNGILCLFENGLEPDGLRRFSTMLAPKCSNLAAVFSSGKNGGYQYAVAGAAGKDVRAFGKEMNAALKGHGGGKPGFVQGSVQASRKEIEAWFARR